MSVRFPETDPLELREIVYRRYCDACHQHDPAAIDLWDPVWRLTEQAHGEQRYADGLPYILHPLGVANILLDWNVEPSVVLAGLLHDIRKHPAFKKPEEWNIPSPEVAELTKKANEIASKEPLAHYASHEEHRQAIYRNLLEDIRVILIRIASRLHNLRFYRSLSDDVCDFTQRNTEELFLPLLRHLRMWNVYSEMEERAFQIRDPQAFDHLSELVASVRFELEPQVADICAILHERIAAVLADIVGEANLSEQLTVAPRWENTHYIYQRHLQTRRREVRTRKALDTRWLYHIRVLVPQPWMAYVALMEIHRCYPALSGDFRDHLARSPSLLHTRLRTAVTVENLHTCRIFIQTPNLCALNQFGITAPPVYRAYQTGMLPDDWAPIEQAALADFLKALKGSDVRANEVVVFTPQGEAHRFPVGATLLDFAYAVHTELGRQTSGATVNDGRKVGLDYELQHGDIIHIHRDENRQYPDEEWLQLVKTERARRKIRAQLNKRPERIGEKRLENALRRMGRSFDRRLQAQAATLARHYGMDSLDDLYRAIAANHLNAQEVARRICYPETAPAVYRFDLDPSEKEHYRDWGEPVYRFAECCHQRLQEDIGKAERKTLPFVGEIRSSRRVIVHSGRCELAAHIPPNRRVRLVYHRAHDALQEVTFTVTASLPAAALVHRIAHEAEKHALVLTNLRLETQTPGVTRLVFTLQSDREHALFHFYELVRTLEYVNTVETDTPLLDERIEEHRRFANTAPTLLRMPFSASRPVDNPRYFVGRKQESRKIERYLCSEKAPGSLLIHGPQRIGKTSLLKYLAHLPGLRRMYTHVFVDLARTTTHSPAAFLRLLCREIKRQVPQVSTTPALGRGEEVFERFSEWLERDVLPRTQYPLLVKLDELGVFVEWSQDEATSAAFFNWLRSFIQHEERIAFILATSDRIVELLKHVGVYNLLNVTDHIALTVLSQKEARALIAEPLHGEVFFFTGALEMLARETGGHPFYLQILGAKLVDHLNQQKRRKVSEADVEHIIEAFVRTSNGAQFYHLWNRQDDVQTLVLAILAADRLRQPLPLHTIVGRLRQQAPDVSEQRIAETLSLLVERQTLVRIQSTSKSDVVYTFQVPLFGRWFARTYPLDLLLLKRRQKNRAF
ncbi:MAG: HD domain-containing protein [Ardenticatenia bacterium]|nr:MAG: HD domain-containing protein [Ardenticatenia bacterium]